jgi:hypothetical protein
MGHLSRGFSQYSITADLASKVRLIGKLLTCPKGGKRLLVEAVMDFIYFIGSIETDLSAPITLNLNPLNELRIHCSKFIVFPTASRLQIVSG